MRAVEIEAGGRKLTGLVEKIQGKLWVHLNGKTYAYDPSARTLQEREKSIVTDGEIKSPMPGKVTKIHVRSGDSVKAHQVLIVLEAMKMEYYLKATADGRVQGIQCEEGDRVEIGQSLIRYSAGESKIPTSKPFKVILTLTADSSDRVEPDEMFSPALSPSRLVGNPSRLSR